jgi:Mn-dependent DtxR family transcriptional regulator
MDERTILTPAHEDYIEAIVELDEQQDGRYPIRSVDIAELLSVSKASVNKAVQALREAGYIDQERYGRITLTESGRAYGTEIWRRHQLLRSFLIDDLGVDPETANKEACEMEHAISSETMDRWVAWLDRLHDGARRDA